MFHPAIQPNWHQERPIYATSHHCVQGETALPLLGVQFLAAENNFQCVVRRFLWDVQLQGNAWEDCISSADEAITVEAGVCMCVVL